MYLCMCLLLAAALRHLPGAKACCGLDWRHALGGAGGRGQLGGGGGHRAPAAAAAPGRGRHEAAGGQHTCRAARVGSVYLSSYVSSV